MAWSNAPFFFFGIFALRDQCRDESSRGSSKNKKSENSSERIRQMQRISPKVVSVFPFRIMIHNHKIMALQRQRPCEDTGLVRQAGTRRLMYAGIVASMVLAVVALQSVGQGPTALDEISWPWMQEGGGQAGADFAWDNQNVGMFEEGCKAGNQKACDSLAASGEALKILNQRSRDVGDNMLVAYVPEGEAQQDGGSDLAAGPMGWDENKVPLAYPIDQSDLAGAGDVGNSLVPKDDPWAKKKKQAGMYGYPTQLALLQQAAGQGLARKPFYTATDPCRPNGPLCGPTRPAEDHGGDVVLTKGWLGEPEEFPCCPCVGKGVKTINYADYPGAGFYNPYTMEMCQLCDGCSLYGKE